MAHTALFFANEWHGLQLFLPLLGQDYGVILNLLTFHRISLGIRMFNHFLDLVWIDGIPHIEKVTLVTLGSLGEFVWKVLFHGLLSHHIIVQILDSNFIPVGWIDK